MEKRTPDNTKIKMYTTSWCGPCKMIGPLVEELSGEYEGKATVGKLDVDQNQDLAVRYGVRSIPTILYFKNGEVVDKLVGALPKAQILEKLESHM